MKMRMNVKHKENDEKRMSSCIIYVEFGYTSTFVCLMNNFHSDFRIFFLFFSVVVIFSRGEWYLVGFKHYLAEWRQLLLIKVVV